MWLSLFPYIYKHYYSKHTKNCSNDFTEDGLVNLVGKPCCKSSAHYSPYGTVYCCL